MSSVDTTIAAAEFSDRVALFYDFLSAPLLNALDYKDRIRAMCKTKQCRLLVSLTDLRNFNQNSATQLLQNPLDWLPPFEKALLDLATTVNDPSYDFDLTRNRLHIGFEGAFGDLQVTPRSLSSRHLSHMMSVEGIVTSCSLIRPKLLRSVHWSEAGKTFLAKEYYDATMVLAGGSAALASAATSAATAYPTEDDQHRRLQSEFGLSTYRDYQTVSVQEMPERAPPGQLPRAVDIVLDDDLVDAVKPGDRVRIVGIYRGMAGIVNGQLPNTFRAVLIANSVRPIGRSGSKTLSESLTASEEEHVRELIDGGGGGGEDLLDRLVPSIAPSIYGHEMIKKAVLLQQVGGVERNLDNGTHIRGDINVLLIGDPSTAKSQMLRYVLGVAPLAVATTGRGSSGVGLTAAVTSDRETGERRLEAGAMVLADRGIVCIDEFDKMSETDRVAIHEVMEQQTVTIAKAGIHTTLNARCSVLAAANPVFGQYIKSKPARENIRLPDSLLSRFDLMFIVLDEGDSESDRRIAEHVLKMHRYLPFGFAEGSVVPDKQSIYDYSLDTDGQAGDDDGDGDTSNGTASGGTHGNQDRNVAGRGELSTGFFKKYIQQARQQRPVLTNAAISVIVDAYCDFRQQREQSEMSSAGGGAAAAAAAVVVHKTFPVTARTLETLIRLATAHAKLRLDEEVTEVDARVAVELVEFCLYKEVQAKKPRKQLRTKRPDAGSGSDGRGPAAAAPRGDDKGKETLTVSQELQDLIIADASQPSTNSTQTLADYGLVGSSGSAASHHHHQHHLQPDDALDQVKEALNALRGYPQLGTFITADRLRQSLPESITWQQMEDALHTMQDSNMIMYRDGVIIFI